MKTGLVYPVLRHDKFIHTDISDMTKDELKETLDGLGYGQIKMLVTSLVKIIQDFRECD